VAHAIEDVLMAAAIAAFAIDRRAPRDLLLDIVRRSLDARSQARSDELRSSARAEAQCLPDWYCRACLETNPGTFDLCWNCGCRAQDDAFSLSPESDAILAIEGATIVKSDCNA
jgi:hypothetical protein